MPAASRASTGVPPQRLTGGTGHVDAAGGQDRIVHVGVLHRRLSALYESVLEGNSSAPSFPRFDAYVEHERSLRGSSRLASAVAHWDAAAGTWQLPLYGDASTGSGRTRRVRVRLGAERAAALRSAAGASPFRALTAQQSQFQLFATVLLAWLHRISGEETVAVGTPWHGRSSAAFRDTAGLFVELFALRVTVGADDTFASLGAKVASATHDAMRHVVPGASVSPGARAFGVVLNFITAQLGDFAGAPVRADWIHAGYGDRDHRVRVQVHDFDRAGDPVVDFDLDEGAFGETEREWAVRHFLTLFEYPLIEGAGTPEGQVPLADLPTLDISLTDTADTLDPALALIAEAGLS